MHQFKPGTTARITVPASSVSRPFFLRGAKTISVYPSSGATSTVYKSSSPQDIILQDRDDGFLDYSEFPDLDYAGSIWWKWASGDVTTGTSEGFLDTQGWSWMIVQSEDGITTVEVCW